MHEYNGDMRGVVLDILYYIYIKQAQIHLNLRYRWLASFDHIASMDTTI